MRILAVSGRQFMLRRPGVLFKLSAMADSVAAIQKAAEILRNGGLVVFPTETVYGLGADGPAECGSG